MSAQLPPGIDLAANQQPAIIGSISLTWAVATIVVGLRFLSRRVAKAKYWIDDWMIIPAWVLITILSLVSITWMIEFGLGRHIYIAPERIPETIEVFFKCLFISEFCYTWVVVTVKFSILAFYWRLFSRNKYVRWPIFVIGGIVTAWGLAVFLIVMLQCIPIQGFWDKTIVNACTVNNKKFFYGNSIPHIVTDFALLLVPLPAVWTLHLSMKQRIGLSAIFMVGIFVSAVSIVRLTYLLELDESNPDVTWTFSITQIWTCVELNVAVMCACLPQLRPLVKLVKTQTTVSSAREDSERLYSRERSVPTVKRSGLTETTVDALSYEEDRNGAAGIILLDNLEYNSPIRFENLALASKRSVPSSKTLKGLSM